MASPISGLFNSPANPAGTTTTTAPANGSASNEQIFLQLLVSQIQNQDPTNPIDGTQFVSQLAQFNELDQLIAIRGDLDGQAAAAANAAAANGANQGTTNVNLPGSSGTPSASGPATGATGTSTATQN